jgi:hypothetical protein
MDWRDIFASVRELWDNQPRTISLLGLGILLFLLLAIDAWWHRKHRKRPRI